MHQGFWGLTVLALVLLGHGAYVWHTAGRSRPGWGVWLPLGLGVICFAAGIAGQLWAAEEAMVHVMGLGLLLCGFWANGALRRQAREENERKTDDEGSDR